MLCDSFSKMHTQYKIRQRSNAFNFMKHRIPPYSRGGKSLRRKMTIKYSAILNGDFGNIISVDCMDMRRIVSAWIKYIRITIP